MGRPTRTCGRPPTKGRPATSWRDGSLLSDLGRLEEAVAARRRLVSLDPLGPLPNIALGIVLARQGHTEEALRHMRRALDVEPEYADGHGWLGWMLVRSGQTVDGLRHAERAVELSHRAPRMMARLAHLLGRAGRREDALRLTAEVESAREGINYAIYVAEAHAGLGQADQAFSALERAFNDNAPALMRIQSNVLLDPLRDDPRYRRLLERLGLPVAP